MRLVVASIAVAALWIGVEARQESKVPKGFVQLIVTGCLKDRILTAIHTPRVADGDELEVTIDRFQVAGKKPLLAEVKNRDREVVEITGLVRKSDLKEPGIRVPGGRIVFGAGRGGDRYNRPSQPSQRVVLLQADSLRPLDKPCER